MAPALPSTARGFGVRPIDLSAGITAYLLVAAVLLPISSWVAERFGALLAGAAVSIPLFWRLAHDIGAEVSGHRAPGLAAGGCR